MIRKYGKNIVLTLSVFMFVISIISLFFTLKHGDNQYKHVGLLIALGSSLFAVYVYLKQKEYSDSEKLLEFLITQFDNVVELIHNNNERMNWITASRIIASIDKISNDIIIEEHKKLFELQKLKYKTIVNNILSDEEKTGSFFYGSKDWNEDIDESAKKSTIPTDKKKKQGLLSDFNFLSEISLYELWEFTQFPKKYDDPLEDQQFSDKEIEFYLQSRFTGLYDYIKHRRKFTAINGKLLKKDRKK